MGLPPKIFQPQIILTCKLYSYVMENITASVANVAKKHFVAIKWRYPT